MVRTVFPATPEGLCSQTARQGTRCKVRGYAPLPDAAGFVQKPYGLARSLASASEDKPATGNAFRYFRTRNSCIVPLDVGIPFTSALNVGRNHCETARTYSSFIPCFHARTVAQPPTRNLDRRIPPSEDRTSARGRVRPRHRAYRCPQGPRRREYPR